MRTLSTATLVVCLSVTTVNADPLNCDLSTYRSRPGLTAAQSEDRLTVEWDGERGEQLRLRFAIDQGTPTIREIAVRPKGGPWNTLATDLSPEYRIVSGLRAMKSLWASTMVA